MSTGTVHNCLYFTDNCLTILWTFVIVYVVVAFCRAQKIYFLDGNVSGMGP
jgi:hypothetical protein